MKISKQLETKGDTHSHHRHQSLVPKPFHNYEMNDIYNCHGDQFIVTQLFLILVLSTSQQLSPYLPNSSSYSLNSCWYWCWACTHFFFEELDPESNFKVHLLHETVI
jgi:hypothetical protein